MTTGYNIREGSAILAARFAQESAGVRTAPFPLPKDGAKPWADAKSSPPADAPELDAV